VTSFFEIKVCVFCVFLKNDKTIFFQDLGENTCSLQPALKSNDPVLELAFYFYKLQVFNKTSEIMIFSTLSWDFRNYCSDVIRLEV